MPLQDEISSKPEWLDDNFVKQCIKTNTGASLEDIVVNDVKLQYALPKGENYSSIIFRVTVNANINDALTKQNGNFVNRNGRESTPPENIDKRYIVKVLIDHNVMSELTNFLQVMGREIDMYKTFIPSLQVLLKQAGLETTFICRCMHVDEKRRLLVMDDLKVQGYILADRIKGADLEHTKLLVCKMARLHAASMKHYEQNTYKDVPAHYFKNFFHHIDDDLLREAVDEVFGNTMITKAVATFAETLSKQPGYEREARLLTNLIDYAYDILCDVYKFKPGNIMNALLHGDCWINNMMFKYDDSGKPVDVMLVDWQIPIINTITNEIMYFLLSSVSDEVREHHYEEIINFYYVNVIETLNAVGYKGIKPTLQQLREGMLVSSSIFLLVLSFMLPVIKAELKEAGDRSKEESIAFEEVTQISDRNKCNPVYIKSLLVSINMLRKIGVFEYHEKLLESYKK